MLECKVFKSWLFLNLPALGYAEAWNLQRKLVAARKSSKVDSDIFLLLEHPPVFTLGRRGGRDNFVVSESFLEESLVPIFHVERGGNVTYHGPGQLIGYGIIDLRAAGLTVTDYVDRLEEVMIRTAAQHGVFCRRDPINRGVWVGDRKLGSIGVALRRGITFHGFALNVNVSLEPFSWINPCGLKGITMTSLEHELSHPLSIAEVRESLKCSIESVFQAGLVPTDLDELRSFLFEDEPSLDQH